LAAVLHRFHYLKYALAILLVFIGSKIFVADLAGWEKFPASWSLAITFAIIESCSYSPPVVGMRTRAFVGVSSAITHQQKRTHSIAPLFMTWRKCDTGCPGQSSRQPPVVLVEGAACESQRT
jgi:hypothetical protein